MTFEESIELPLGGAWNFAKSKLAAFARLSVCVGLAALIAACTTVDPERALVSAAPSRDPVKTRTSFSDALRCLDNQVAKRSLANLPQKSFWVTDVKDGTSAVTVGARTMVENAIRTAANRSRRFEVRRLFLTRREGHTPLPFDNPGVAMQKARESVNYIVDGAIPTFDRNVQDGQAGGGVAIADVFSISASRKDINNVISLDLQLIDPRTESVLQASSNTMVLDFSNVGANAGAEIGKFGTSFNFNISRANGTGQAVRTLIELGVIELIGEELRLPYWECLSVPATNPQVTERIYDWWAQMSQTERDEYLRQRLVALGYLSSGAAPAAYPQALARFQTANGLVATGRSGLESYAALLHEKPIPGGQFAEVAPPPKAPKPTLETRAKPDIWTSTGYDKQIGYVVAFTLDAGAFVNCYLKLATGEFVHLLPNQFQPQRYFKPGSHTVPDASVYDKYQIRPGKGSSQMGVSCIATGRDVYAELPEWLKKPAFTVLPGATLKKIDDAYRATNHGFFDRHAAGLQKVNL